MRLEEGNKVFLSFMIVYALGLLGFLALMALLVTCEK